ncbi:MAG: phenylalanine--tRNA ligase subunit beta [Acidobacteriota bacterium]
MTGLQQQTDELEQALTRVGLNVGAVEGKAEDAILDVEVPSNRPDCLGHRGLARELAAALNGRLSPLEVEGLPPERADAPDPVHIEIENVSLCQRYSARRVANVRFGESPEWMRRRLERSDIRPLHLIVDITNYVMLETGQPLHAFDYERLAGGCLIVRNAREAEMIQTLDGIERRLTAGNLIIADAERPVALAGVMGGLHSEIRSHTQNLVIESARFDPLAVRRTTRAVGMRTEGSHRFERGTDSEGTLPAANRAAALMARLAGGEVHPRAIDLYPGARSPTQLRLRLTRLEAVLGLAIPAGKARTILERLGFRILPARTQEVLEVEIPAYRADVSCEEDLMEEVARHHGYDRIPASLPAMLVDERASAGVQDPLPSLLAALHAHGFTEGICTVFVHGEDNRRLMNGNERSVRLRNPLSETGGELRRSLLPGLLAAVCRNLNHGARAVALYEVGVIFRCTDDSSKPEEEPRLALVRAGLSGLGSWDRRPRRADLYDVKGALEEGLERAGWPSLSVRQEVISWLHPGRGAQLYCGGECIGVLGELHPDTAASMGLESGVCVTEVSLAALSRTPLAPRHFTPIARTPAVSRDLALVVPRERTFAEIADSIRSLDTRIVEVEAFDRYESEQFGPDHVSLALRITYHHPERTLVSEEVQELEQQILSRLQERFKVALRGS